MLTEQCHPVSGERTDHDGLLDLIGDKRFVLIGECSHGPGVVVSEILPSKNEGLRDADAVIAEVADPPESPEPSEPGHPS